MLRKMWVMDSFLRGVWGDQQTGINLMLYSVFSLKAPLFKGGWEDQQTGINLMLYSMFSLKAPLFKGGWGGSDAIKQPTFSLIL
jgi:hypothetical protein